MKISFNHKVLKLDTPQIMGILNVTPDSFSDGGKWDHVDKALEHATLMVKQGATIIDIGGESTRPGAKSVPLEEESAVVMVSALPFVKSTSIFHLAIFDVSASVFRLLKV